MVSFLRALKISASVLLLAACLQAQVPNLPSGTTGNDLTISNFFSLKETTAPSGVVNQDVCYGDSSAHSIECSFNNGSFFKLPLAGQANSWTAAQSFGSGDLLPSAAGGTDVGSASLPFGNVWIGGAATNNIKLTGTGTAARVATLPDNTGTVAELNLAQTWSAAQSFGAGDFLPSTAGGTDIGSTSLPFGNIWLGGAATNNFELQPSSTTGARIITIPDFGLAAATTQHLPFTAVLTSQYTNSTTGFTNVAGGNTLQFPVNASQTYTAVCHLYYQAAATGGLNIEFTGPASPTSVTYGLDDPSAATTFNSSVATSYSTSLGQVVGTATTNFDAIVSFALVNGTNAGTVNLLAKSSAAVQLQIQTGSFCQVQ